MPDNYLSQGYTEFWIKFDPKNRGKMKIDGVEYDFPQNAGNFTDGNEWHKIVIDLSGDGEKSVKHGDKDSDLSKSVKLTDTDSILSQCEHDWTAYGVASWVCNNCGKTCGSNGVIDEKEPRLK